jgi:hypothetical protein
MNFWGIRIYFTKSRFSLNGGLFVYMELLSGHDKIITKSGISLNARTLNRGFTVLVKRAMQSLHKLRNMYRIPYKTIKGTHPWTAEKSATRPHVCCLAGVIKNADLNTNTHKMP